MDVLLYLIISYKMDILLYTVCILEPTLNKCYYTVLYYTPAPKIWPCQVTQEAHFEKIIFFPNSAFNIRKIYKISIVPQLSKCLKFEAVWGVLTDQMI